MDNNKIILDFIKANLGKDFNDNYNELGCAQAVNNILKACLGYVAGGGPSTAQMLKEVVSNPNFKEVTTSEARPGDIILSATGTGNGALAHGHVGFLGENGTIYSNDSMQDKLLANFTAEKWKNYYTIKGGFPPRYFRAVSAPLVVISDTKPVEVVKNTEIEVTPTGAVAAGREDSKSPLFSFSIKGSEYAFSVSSTKIFMLVIAFSFVYLTAQGILDKNDYMMIAIAIISFYTGLKVNRPN